MLGLCCGSIKTLKIEQSPSLMKMGRGQGGLGGQEESGLILGARGRAGSVK